MEYVMAETRANFIETKQGRKKQKKPQNSQAA